MGHIIPEPGKSGTKKVLDGESSIWITICSNEISLSLFNCSFLSEFQMKYFMSKFSAMCALCQQLLLPNDEITGNAFYCPVDWLVRSLYNSSRPHYIANIKCYLN